MNIYMTDKFITVNTYMLSKHKSTTKKYKNTYIYMTNKILIVNAYMLSKYPSTTKIIINIYMTDKILNFNVNIIFKHTFIIKKNTTIIIFT